MDHLQPGFNIIAVGAETRKYHDWAKIAVMMRWEDFSGNEFSLVSDSSWSVSRRGGKRIESEEKISWFDMDFDDWFEKMLEERIAKDSYFLELIS